MKKILFIIFEIIFKISRIVSKIIKKIQKIPQFVQIYFGWCIAGFLMLLCAVIYILCAYNAVLLTDYADRNRVITEYVGNAALGLCASFIVAIGLEISMNNSKKRKQEVILSGIKGINFLLEFAIRIPDKIVFDSYNKDNRKNFNNTCTLALPILENDEAKRKIFYNICDDISSCAIEDIQDMKMMDSDEWKYISELYGFNSDYIKNAVVLFETMNTFSYMSDQIKDDFCSFQNKLNVCLKYSREFDNDIYIKRYCRTMR